MGEISDFFDSLPTVYVKSPARTESGQSKEGKPYKRSSQEAILSYTDGGIRIAIPCQIRVEEGFSYPVGEYKIHGSQFRVNRFQSLEANPFDTKLIPIPEAFSRLIEQDRQRKAA